MIRTSVIILVYLLCGLRIQYTASAQAQSPEFSHPWTDTTTAILIDPYSGNTLDWDKLQTDKRVAAVIHRASQGLTPDDKYNDRKKIARDRGLLWGSYHLGKPGDPEKQADYYLGLTGEDTQELMALDLESLDTTQFMSLKNAEKFVSRIYERTARYPLIYCNNRVFAELTASITPESVLLNCGIWYARFRSDIPDFNTSRWNTYSLWQFSCEINCTGTGNCLYTVAGADRFMDVNVYYGTVQDLRDRWPLIAK